MCKFSRIGRRWSVIIKAMILLTIGLVVVRVLGFFTTTEAIDIFLIAALVLVTAVYASETINISKSSDFALRGWWERFE